MKGITGTSPKRVFPIYLTARASENPRFHRRPLLKQCWWWSFHFPVACSKWSQKKSNRETKNTLTVLKYFFFDQMKKSFGSNFFFSGTVLATDTIRVYWFFWFLFQIPNNTRLCTKTKISTSFFFFWSGRTQKTKNRARREKKRVEPNFLIWTSKQKTS